MSDENERAGSFLEGFTSAPDPQARPETAGASGHDGEAVLTVHLAELLLTTPPRVGGTFGQTPPPQPGEHFKRARLFVQQLLPLLAENDEPAAMLALHVHAAHQYGAALSLQIAREHVAMRDQLVPPE